MQIQNPENLPIPNSTAVSDRNDLVYSNAQRSAFIIHDIGDRQVAEPTPVADGHLRSKTHQGQRHDRNFAQNLRNGVLHPNNVVLPDNDMAHAMPNVVHDHFAQYTQSTTFATGQPGATQVMGMPLQDKVAKQIEFWNNRNKRKSIANRLGQLTSVHRGIFNEQDNLNPALEPVLTGATLPNREYDKLRTKSGGKALLGGNKDWRRKESRNKVRFQLDRVTLIQKRHPHVVGRFSGALGAAKHARPFTRNSTQQTLRMVETPRGKAVSNANVSVEEEMKLYGTATEALQDVNGDEKLNHPAVRGMRKSKYQQPKFLDIINEFSNTNAMVSTLATDEHDPRTFDIVDRTHSTSHAGLDERKQLFKFVKATHPGKHTMSASTQQLALDAKEFELKRKRLDEMVEWKDATHVKRRGGDRQPKRSGVNKPGKQPNTKADAETFARAQQELHTIAVLPGQNKHSLGQDVLPSNDSTGFDAEFRQVRGPAPSQQDVTNPFLASLSMHQRFDPQFNVSGQSGYKKLANTSQIRVHRMNDSFTDKHFAKHTIAEQETSNPYMMERKMSQPESHGAMTSETAADTSTHKATITMSQKSVTNRAFANPEISAFSRSSSVRNNLHTAGLIDIDRRLKLQKTKQLSTINAPLQMGGPQSQWGSTNLDHPRNAKPVASQTTLTDL